MIVFLLFITMTVAIRGMIAFATDESKDLGKKIGAFLWMLTSIFYAYKITTILI